MKRGRRAVSLLAYPGLLARLAVTVLAALAVAPSPASAQPSPASPRPVAEGPELTFLGNPLAADLLPGGDLVAARAGGVYDIESCFRRWAPCTGVPPAVFLQGRFGPAIHLPSSTPGTRQDPRLVRDLAVAADAAGGSVAVWRDFPYTNIRFNQVTGGLGIAGQRFDPAGVPVGPVFQVNVTPPGDQGRPAVSHDPRGGFVIVWERGSPGNIDVLARRLAEDGTPTGPEIEVAAGRDFESTPAVAHGPDGSFLVVWRASPASGEVGAWELLARRYDPGGNPGEVARIDLGSGDAGYEPVVRAAPGGGFVAGWSTSGPTSGTSTLNFWARRLDDTGQPLGAALPLNLRPVVSSSSLPRLDLAPDEAGGFLAAWENRPPRGGLSPFGGQLMTALYATYYDGQDQALVREMRLDTIRGYTNRLLRVVSDGRRGYTVVWRRVLGSRQDDSEGLYFSELGEGVVRRFNLPGGACAAGPETLCLADGRFQVEARLRNQHGGNALDGAKAGATSFSGETGLFSFFAPEAVDLLVKVIDGRTINGSFWLFDGSLTDVEYWLHALDTRTGRVVLRHNPPGTLCGKADTGAFPDPSGPAAASAGFEAGPAPAAGVPFGNAAELFSLAAPLQSGTCAPDAETLCLLDGRFAVRVQWQTAQGAGVGRAIPGTDATGFFWFFAPGNLELAVKLLDGRALTGKFWVFYGALTDVGYLLTVTDTATGASRTYRNRAGNLCGRGDTTAL